MQSSDRLVCVTNWRRDHELVVARHLDEGSPVRLSWQADLGAFREHVPNTRAGAPIDRTEYHSTGRPSRNRSALRFAQHPVLHLIES